MCVVVGGGGACMQLVREYVCVCVAVVELLLRFVLKEAVYVMKCNATCK